MRTGLCNADPSRAAAAETLRHGADYASDAGAGQSAVLTRRDCSRAKGQPIKLVVQVPTNVSFAASVRIQTGDDDPGLSAPFARCLPIGCFADFDMKEETLKKFGAARGAGRVSFADAGGHDVAVPLSFNGFGQAFDALERE